MESTLIQNARAQLRDTATNGPDKSLENDDDNAPPQLSFQPEERPITATLFHKNETSLLKEISLWKEHPPAKVENGLKIRLLGSYFFPRKVATNGAVNVALAMAVKKDVIPEAKIVFGR